jgi:hypothetical protein
MKNETVKMTESKIIYLDELTKKELLELLNVKEMIQNENTKIFNY